MRHLANAHSVTGPAGSIYTFYTGRRFLASFWRDRSRKPVKQLSIGVGCINAIK